MENVFRRFYFFLFTSLSFTAVRRIMKIPPNATEIKKTAVIIIIIIIVRGKSRYTFSG